MKFMNWYIGFALVFVVVIVAVFWYTSESAGQRMQVDVYTWGTYPYTCDDDSTFDMSPAQDMSTLKLAFVDGRIFTLGKAEASSGVRYEGRENMVFTAQGETVQLLSEQTTLTCKPVPNPDEAPFNFGD